MRHHPIFPGLAACLFTTSPVLVSPASAGALPSFMHVLAIVSENEALSQVNSSSAPPTSSIPRNPDVPGSPTSTALPGARWPTIRRSPQGSTPRAR